MNEPKETIRNTKLIANKTEEERKLILAFVDHLKKCGYPGIKPPEWPEDSNRNSPEVDTIAGELVIEHTSIDIIFDQRKYEDYFSRMIGGLESTALPFRLNVNISHTDIVENCNSSRRCVEVNKALDSWVKSSEVLSLPEGMQTISVKGVPFPIKIKKQSNRPTGIYFSRKVSSETEFLGALKKQLDRKISKFNKYKSEPKGKRTILLIENRDLALANVGDVFDEIRKTYPNGLPSIVEEIWYADTSGRNHIVFEKFSAKTI